MFGNIVTPVQLFLGAINGWFTQTLSGNTIVAGAITASIIGSLVFTLRKVPRVIWSWVKRWVFFTYKLEYNIMDGQSMINTVAEKFEWELQRRVSRRRAEARLITRHKRIVESLADGGFFFIYNRAPIYVSRSRASQTGTPVGKGGADNVSPSQTTVTLALTTLRFHRSAMLGILNESAREYTVPGVYQVIAPGWRNEEPRLLRVRNFTSLPPLAIDAQLKVKVDTAIANFLKHRTENNRLDKAHKLVFMLYGEPGTGKSALAEYIAFKLKTSLFCINGQTGDGHYLSLGMAIKQTRDYISDDEIPVLLCDDFDTIWQGLRKRTEEDKKNEATAGVNNSSQLGSMLTALQSPTEINDCVVVFTTNHLEKIDPAIYRPGRVTVLLEVGRMTPKSVMEYFEMSYSSKWPSSIAIEKRLRACDVSAFYNQNQDNPKGFIDGVTSVALADDEIFNQKVSELVP